MASGGVRLRPIAGFGDVERQNQPQGRFGQWTVIDHTQVALEPTTVNMV